jgi:SAM-dependent methyltransferase
MDLQRVELDFAAGRGTVCLVDAAGSRTVPLSGAALQRVAALAVPPPRQLVIDAAAKTATRDGEAVDFAEVVPLLRAVVGEVRPPHVTIDYSTSDVRFWATCYQTGTDGWEMMRPAPPLARWFAAHPPAGQRALVVGCGRGHEARLLARLGAAVVAVDFAAVAIAEARRLAAAEGVTLDLRQRDLFTLGDDPERYDLLVEHCCFCAIEPQRRPEYVEMAARVLAPGGALVGLFWNRRRPDGPPYGVDEAELERLFSPRFSREELSVPPDSAPLRHGQELLAVWRRR